MTQNARTSENQRSATEAVARIGVLRLTTYEDYAFDIEAIKAAFPAELAEALADDRTEDEFIRESVGELLDRHTGRDHYTKGKLVWRTGDDEDADWEMP